MFPFLNRFPVSIFKMVQTSTYVKRSVYAVTKTVSKRVCHLFSTTTVLYLNTNFTNSFDWILRTKHPVTLCITNSLTSISNIYLVFPISTQIYRGFFPCTHIFIKTLEFRCKWLKLNNVHQIWGCQKRRCLVSNFCKCWSKMLPDSTRTTTRWSQNPRRSSLWNIIINLGTYKKYRMTFFILKY